MATRKIKINGYNHEEGTEATVLFDGVSVFSGALTTGIVSDSDVIGGTAVPGTAIFEFTYENSDDTVETAHTLSINVTAGWLRAGVCLISCGNDNIASWDEWDGPGSSAGMLEIDGDYYYSAGEHWPYGDGSDTAQAERTNCLIDGEVPSFNLVYDAEMGSGVPTGVLPNDPTFSGHKFIVNTGETFTCTVRVPKLLPAYVAP
jgi:hypothetical protein